MSQLDIVFEQFAGDNTESESEPMPLRIAPWGENRVLGIVLENTERKLIGGIYKPDTKATMDRPHSCQIVRVSEKVTDEYPTLKRLSDLFGDKIFDGPYVRYRWDGGGEATYTNGRDHVTVINMHARNIMGAYIPKSLREDLASVGITVPEEPTPES